MSHKWKVLKDDNGPIEAGYVEYSPALGQSVDEYDGPQKAIMDSISTRCRNKDAKGKALKDIDASAIADPVLKKVVEFLQAKHG